MAGAYIPADVDRRVREAARHRCGYCLSPQHLVMAGLQIEHIVPRNQLWSEHFRWSEDGIRILGLTPTGRATVAILRLADDPDAILVRSYWVEAGWHPPE